MKALGLVLLLAASSTTWATLTEDTGLSIAEILANKSLSKEASANQMMVDLYMLEMEADSCLQMEDCDRIEEIESCFSQVDEEIGVLKSQAFNLAVASGFPSPEDIFNTESISRNEYEDRLNALDSAIRAANSPVQEAVFQVQTFDAGYSLEKNSLRHRLAGACRFRASDSLSIVPMDSYTVMPNMDGDGGAPAFGSQIPKGGLQIPAPQD